MEVNDFLNKSKVKFNALHEEDAIYVRFDGVIDLLNDYKKQLRIGDVDSSFSIGFAQYIAEEHYRLVNLENGKYYWANEIHLKTSNELLLDYKNISN